MPIGKHSELIPGTRLLQSSLGLIGRSFPDPSDSSRVWTISNTLGPVGCKSDGVRVRAVDRYGFTSFIGHMDLSLVLGKIKPGNLDPWTSELAYEIGDVSAGWVGMRATYEDLADDLHIRELELRAQYGWENGLPALDLTRYVHTKEGTDEMMLEKLLWDADPDTGIGPDARFHTLHKRWSQVQREVTKWQ